MFKFFLDNTQVSDPLNWIDFEEVIERDADLKLILPKYDVNLKFVGDGYSYIREKYKANGFCHLIELRIEKKCDNNYSTILNGYIFVSDCKFNLTRCLVECSVTDNSYTAKIFNNKNIKTVLTSTLSKNGETITPPTALNCGFFTPSTGLYGATRKVYNIIDVFTYLVSFISDGSVGFESNYLATLLDGGEIGLVSGREIRLGNNSSPEVSFQDVFENLSRKVPLGMTVVDRGGIPTIKIENESFFYASTESVTIKNIPDLEQSFDKDRLYSSLKLGESTSYTPVINSLVEIRWKTFKEEEYFFGGVCNVDRTLDLTTTILCNSNAIEELYATNISNDAYDDTAFFIHYNSVPNAIATTNLTTPSLTYYYNDFFLNENVAARYNFASDIVHYLGNNDLGFMASKTNGTAIGYSVSDPATVIAPTLQSVSPLKIGFNNDSTSPNYDATGNWSTTLNRYIAPTTGQYLFGFNLILDVNKGLTAFLNYKFRFIVEVRHYNGSNVLQNTYYNYYPSLTGFYTGGAGIYQPVGSALTYLDSTTNDYVDIYYWWEYQQYNKNLDASMSVGVRDYSWFKTLVTTDGGGIYKTDNNNESYKSIFEFERAISDDEYATMKQDLSYALKVEDYKTWIKTVRRKLATSETTFELISNLDNSK